MVAPLYLKGNSNTANVNHYIHHFTHGKSRTSNYSPFFCSCKWFQTRNLKKFNVYFGAWIISIRRSAQVQLFFNMMMRIKSGLLWSDKLVTACPYQSKSPLPRPWAAAANHQTKTTSQQILVHYDTDKSANQRLTGAEEMVMPWNWCYSYTTDSCHAVWKCRASTSPLK